MFGDLMSNMQQKQAELKEKLSGIVITETLRGVTISGTAAKEITDIHIASEYLVGDRKEELEDLLMVALNNLAAKMSAEEAKANESMVNELLPGMGGLLGM